VQMKKPMLAVSAIIVLLILTNDSYGQGIISYVDKDGVQVFTNIPPVNHVGNLKVTGPISSPVPG
jgi:hypothetical protein